MARRASRPRERYLPSCCVRTFVLLIAAALALLAGSPGIAFADGGRPQANPEQRAAAMIRPAVMYLAAQAHGQVRLPDGQLLSALGEGSGIPFTATWTCTGFVVNPDGWVATAGHCVDPQTAKQLILKRAVTEFLTQLPNSPAGQNPAATLDWLTKNARVEGQTPDRGPEISLMLGYGTGTKLAEKLPATVVDFRPMGKGDVALLKVQKHNLPSSELGTDADVSIGAPVLAVGFPETTQRVTGMSLDPTNKSGKVSKKSTMESSPIYEIDAPVAEGMSGGPTVELNGKVIGVNSFGPVGEPQPFNFIAPADSLAALLAGKGVKPMLGPADLYYRQGLNHYFSGQYSDAIYDFDQALALSPDYPGVADLKTSAANLRQQYGDAPVFLRSKPVWYTVSGVLLLLTVGGWVTFMVRKSRRQRRTEAEAEAMAEAEAEAEANAEAEAEAERHAEAAAEATAADARPPRATGTVRPLGLVPAPSSEPHFCANCGAALHLAEKFCPNCGRKIPAGESAKPA
ncbi:trypsin [Mycobacterium kansasii]|nr:trypsin [Mycobacterium kansasii]